MAETRRVTAVPARVLAVAVLALLALAAAAAPSLAHSQVISVYPADGSNVPAVPAEVVVTFSEAPQALGTTARVIGPNETLDVTPDIKGTTVRIGLPPSSPAGQYRVEWRITSADGHPVTGTTTFTGDTPSSGASPPDGTQPGTTDLAPTESATTDQPAPSDPTESAPATTDTAAPTVSDTTSATGPESSESQTSQTGTADDGGSNGLSPAQLLIVGLVIALGLAAAVTAGVLWFRRR